jgi:hypothetical protein
MASIHYFQRYAQPENVATNNTLLLLSRLYQASPSKFKGFLNELLEDASLEVGVEFNQQKKGKKSVPDAILSQSSFKILVETKLHKNFDLAQLSAHLESFGEEEQQFLLSLSPQTPDNKLKNQINSVVSEFNQTHQTTIKYVATTFQSIIDKYKNCLEVQDYVLGEICADYEAYCVHDQLIKHTDALMRVVPCGWSLPDNEKFDLYYAPSIRGYSEHTYLGFYAQKSVQGIGKIENILNVEFNHDTQQLTVLDSLFEITSKQTQNIVGAIQNNKPIATGHTFFCVEQFYKTDFKKNTKFPLQGSKFFNLKEVLNLSILPAVAEIALQLKTVQW